MTNIKWQIYAIVKAKNIHRMFGYIIAKWWAWSTAGRFLLSQAWGCRFESMNHQSWGNKHLLSVPRDVNGPLITWSTKGSILKILGMDLFFRPDQSDFSRVRSTLSDYPSHEYKLLYYIKYILINIMLIILYNNRLHIVCNTNDRGLQWWHYGHRANKCHCKICALF